MATLIQWKNNCYKIFQYASQVWCLLLI